MFFLKTKYSNLQFTLLPHAGETSIENIGIVSKNSSLDSDITILKIEGSENGKSGFYVTALVNKTALKSANNLSDLIFLNGDGIDISSRFIGQSEFNTSCMRFNNNILFFECENATSCEDIETIKCNLSATYSTTINLPIEDEEKVALLPNCDITIGNFAIKSIKNEYNTFSFDLSSEQLSLNNPSIVINAVLKNKNDEYQLKKDLVISPEKIGLYCEVKKSYTQVQGVLDIEIGGIPLYIESNF